VLVKGDIRGLLLQSESFSHNPGFREGLLLIFLMMILNWSIEAFKWQRLVRKIEPIRFIKALQSVIAGISVSIFSPNRTGEFIGRVFTLKTQDTVQAIFLSIIGSMSQLLVTILMGSLSFCIFFPYLLPAEHTHAGWTSYLLIPGILLADIILLAGYLRVSYINQLTGKVLRDRFGKLSEYLTVIGSLSRIELFGILLLSLGRFIVFNIQFYLMFRIFGIDIPFLHALGLIAVIFLALAIIPTFAFSELGVRGSVSLYLVGAYVENVSGNVIDQKTSLAIVLAAGLLWMINLAIPAILGVPALFKLKFFRK
jgi:hypothetical protein